MEPLESYIQKFNEILNQFKKLVPTVSSVDTLQGEKQIYEFIRLFRELLRIKNSLITFSDFSHKNLNIPEQDFEDYKSKYLDIYESVKQQSDKEKVSILNDVDFELELIRRDDINIDYILGLL